MHLLMRSSLVCGWDLTECLERLTANAEVAKVLGSIPASSDTVESCGRHVKQCWTHKYQKIRKKTLQINPQIRLCNRSLPNLLISETDLVKFLLAVCMYLCRQWLWKTRVLADQLLQWYLALCIHMTMIAGRRGKLCWLPWLVAKW